MRLIDSMPALSDELKRLLLGINEQQLSEKIENLRIIEKCSCHDDFCASFYTAPKPRGKYGSTHRCVPLEPEHGLIVMDVVDEEIMHVEVLYRDDVKTLLTQLFPEN